MYTHHKFDHEFPSGTEQRVAYMVCALPRSGSSLLCELLCNSGLAGAPTEFFDAETRQGFERIWGTQGFDAYVAALVAKKTSPNGVFGFKIHSEQFEESLRDLDLTSWLRGLQFIHIDRRDKLRQAISFARALQTNQWASDHPHSGVEPRFDRAQIDECLTRIARMATMWERFFLQHSLSPSRIVYEDLVVQPIDVLRSTLTGLGVAVEALEVQPVTLEQQADSLTERWVEAYLERS